MAVMLPSHQHSEMATPGQVKRSISHGSSPSPSQTMNEPKKQRSFLSNIFHMGKSGKDLDDQITSYNPQSSSPKSSSKLSATVSVISQEQLGLKSQLFTMENPNVNEMGNVIDGTKDSSILSDSSNPTNPHANTSSSTANILPVEPAEDAPDSVKLNYIMSILKSMPIIAERVTSMQQSLNTSTQRVENMETCMSSKCQYMEARCEMLEDRMKKMEQRMEELEFHQMKQNVIIYNLPYSQGEVPKNVVTEFFTTKMKIPKEELAILKIDVAHRIGRANQRGPSRMVVKMASLDGQLNLMKYASNLKGTNYSISVQLPKATQERRSAQLGLLKQERQSNPNEKCRLVKDKLLVGKQEINPQFEYRPLTPNAGLRFDSVKLCSSNEITEKGSKFQAHAMRINSDEEASQGLAAVIKDHARASHRVYAYRYTDPISGIVVTGHSDDREWGASKLVLEQLNQVSASCLVVITRYFGGINLGHRRFDLYQQAARAAASQV